jgi:hypothetical protein
LSWVEIACSSRLKFGVEQFLSDFCVDYGADGAEELYYSEEAKQEAYGIKVCVAGAYKVSGDSAYDEGDSDCRSLYAVADVLASAPVLAVSHRIRNHYSTANGLSDRIEIHSASLAELRAFNGLC